MAVHGDVSKSEESVGCHIAVPFGSAYTHVFRHVCRHAFRHVNIHVYAHVCRHAFRHVYRRRGPPSALDGYSADGYVPHAVGYRQKALG